MATSTRAHGKICYLEIPATDIAVSADFYRGVFGWQTRTRGDGALAFDDGLGEVSGTWVTGRTPSEQPGLAHGGHVVQPIGVDAPEITARFRDPAGNVIALYQEPDAV